ASDADLLLRFAVQHDATAFEQLMRRHGPMVMRVCQRVLHKDQEAEDAFQATFIVLMKKGGAIARPELLGGWLHGVACRIALKARAGTYRQRARVQALNDLPVEDRRDSQSSSGLNWDL